MAVKTKKGKKASKIAVAFLRAERSSLILQGVVSILFGIAAVFWPGITVGALVYLVSAFLVVDGIVTLVLGFVNIGKKPNVATLLVLFGFLQLVIGVIFFRWPDVALETIILVLGLLLIVRGLFAFAHTFSDRFVVATARSMQAAIGIVSLIVGLILVVYPITTILVLVWVVGIYALVTGPILFAMAADINKTLTK